MPNRVSGANAFSVRITYLSCTLHFCLHMCRYHQAEKLLYLFQNHNNILFEATVNSSLSSITIARLPLMFLIQPSDRKPNSPSSFDISHTVLPSTGHHGQLIIWGGGFLLARWRQTPFLHNHWCSNDNTFWAHCSLIKKWVPQIHARMKCRCEKLKDRWSDLFGQRVKEGETWEVIAYKQTQIMQLLRRCNETRQGWGPPHSLPELKGDGTNSREHVS